MKRTLTVTIETNYYGNTFNVGVLEGETGCTAEFKDLPFKPHEHQEFDEQIGNEIYSWVIDAFEYDEAEEEEK